jgi:hypothetical protein
MYDPKSHAASPTASKYAAWAIVLMVIGWLIAITTGLCTGFFVIAGLADGSSGGEFSGADLVLMALFIGGIPCLFGVGLILIGRTWGKRKPPPVSPEVFR